MSEEIKIIFDVVKWLTPVVAGIVAFVVNTQRNRIKELSKKIEEIEEKLIEIFREGLKEERKFRMDVMEKHDRHIEKIFGKIKDICVNNERMKTELEACVKVCERIRFK